MKGSIRYALLILVAAASMSFVTDCAGGPLSGRRWVFIRRTLRVERDVTDILDIVRRASRAGYNGVVLECAFDWILYSPPEYFDRLDRIKQACGDAGLEVIPAVLSVSGGAVLRRDKHLVAGVPVKGAPFVVRDNVARVVGHNLFDNGDFENYSGERFAGFANQDKPGEVSFVDRDVFHDGGASLRVENFEKSDGMGRVTGVVDVEPFRTYRFGCWVRSQELPPTADVALGVRTPDGRILMDTHVKMASTEDWRYAATGFNSLGYDKVRIYIGVWRGTSGRLWIDDVGVMAAGPSNVVRREGTPVSVTGETGIAYREGDDYEPIVDPQMNQSYDHTDPPIRIPAGSRIKEGERLTIDYYQAFAIRGIPILCPSQPALYEFQSEVIERLNEVLRPRSYLISPSEVRGGGWCLTCTGRGLSPAAIMGSCFARQAALIREVNPDARLYAWSDMLDPAQNARDDYFLYNGDISGSWEFVPDDLTILCWGRKPRTASVDHFDRLGFGIMAAAYYDADSVEDVKGWVAALARSDLSRGFMYTTWHDRYDFLETFSEITGPSSRKD